MTYTYIGYLLYAIVGLAFVLSHFVIFESK